MSLRDSSDTLSWKDSHDWYVSMRYYNCNFQAKYLFY